MSGAEVLGIASGIITLLEATAKLYHAAKDASGLPEALNDVASRLPLVQRSLVRIHDTLLLEQPDDADRQALGRALEACHDKAAALEAIFQAIIPSARASKMERYRKAMYAVSKSDKATFLMEGILADLQLMTSMRVLQRQAGLGYTDIMAMVTIAPRERTCSPATIFSNTGSGSQFNHEGGGSQHINFGHGPQFHGPITGSLYFTTQP
jgi:hypothetical protein